MQVWKGADKVVELNDIIPYNNVLRNFSPLFYIRGKICAGGVIRNGFIAADLDAAEHDVDIVARLDGFRRMPAIFIGKGRDHLIGKLIRYLVHEIDNGSRWRSFAIIDPFTVVTGTVVAIVVLAH